MHMTRKRKKEASTKELSMRQMPAEKYFQIVREQLALNGKATIRITGTSMKPFLSPIRDTVDIIPPDDTLKRGDIVLANTPNGYILHRVTRISEKDFDMRGDNTIRGEKKLPKTYLVGVVTCAMRNGHLIHRNSFIYKEFSTFSPIHYTWKTLWNKMLRPIVSKVYHIFRDNITEEN